MKGSWRHVAGSSLPHRALGVLAACLVLLFAPSRQTARFEPIHLHADVGRGNYHVMDDLLWHLGGRLKRFRKNAGRYPRSWGEVPDLKSLVEYFRYTFSDSPGNSPRWRLKYHELVIVEASVDDYLVHVFDRRGRLGWALDTCGSPQQLLPEICLCNEHGGWPEPRAFLYRVAFYFTFFFAQHDRRPATWAETRDIARGGHGRMQLHALFGEEHLENDPRGFAPVDAKTDWKPYGSAYTYVLSEVDGSYYVRSFNDDGLPDYYIHRSAAAKPVVGSPVSNSERLNAMR